MSKKNIFTYPFSHEPWQQAWESLQGYIKDGTFASKFKKAVTKPFIIVDDEESKCKRVFLTQEDADRWFEARAEQTMTPEIADLEFAGNTIPGTEQFQLNANVHNNPAYSKTGSKGNVVIFDFSTVDKIAQTVVGESVDVYVTVSNASGTRQTSDVFSYKQETQTINLDNLLTGGQNIVTLLFRGRSTGLQKVITMTYTMVSLELESSFAIEQGIAPNIKFSVAGRCKGDYARTVHYYIDGQEVAVENISALETDAQCGYEFDNTLGTWAAGPHSLQMKAFMTVGGIEFKSNLLYREFIIKGADVTTTLISVDFPPEQEPFKGNVPGLTGKQFVTQQLEWAYYSSNIELQHANVVWRLYANGVEIAIGSRQADVVEGEVDKKPDPVKFMPTESGEYNLQALVKGNVIKSYTIAVEANEELYEPRTGLTMKLSGLGRSNDEPDETKESWANNGAYAEWHGMRFDASSGYNDDAVCLVNGAYAIIKGNKPMATDLHSVTSNGLVVEMDFMSYNVDDDDVLIARIGNEDGTGCGIFIYPTRAILRDSLGLERVVRYKTDERVKVAFIVYPNSSSLSDTPRFNFIQVNGVRAFPRQYDMTANFNVGSTEDESNLGLIHLGDPTGMAGIKVYCIRTYNNAVSAQGLLNNFIIDNGDNLEDAIKRNSIFRKGSTTEIDVEKVEGLMPMVKLTGDIDNMIGSAGKPELDAGFELTHPDYYDLFKTCTKAHLKKAGQSTQDFLAPPSIHIKFNKNKDNKLLDRDGKQYPKNRAPILPGMTPENSLRMLNNILDSSNCHGGGALTFINEIYTKAQIDGKNILRNPAQEYVLSGQYASEMSKLTGKPIEECQFPYQLNFTPVGFPAIAVWRRTVDDPYEFLGIYTVIEEKKAFYANGGHSIRNKVADDGTLDPFDIKSGKDGQALYNNDGFLQFELVTASDVTFLEPSASQTWDNNPTERETAWEKISEHSDETPEQTADDWEVFGNEVIKPLSATYGNQEAFDAIVWDIMHKENVVAFYIVMMVICGTDSSFRNEEWVRYNENEKWRLKQWDLDMILGLLQDTYSLDAPPMADLYTKVNGNYIYNGIGDIDKGERGFWFWHALMKNKEFNDAIPVVYQAMYAAGWNKKNIIAAFDKFKTSYSPALYNIDGNAKYLNPFFNYGRDYFVAAQGDRTSHRHWFLDTNVDFFEQKWGVGDFMNIRTYTRAGGAANVNVYLKAGATAYFGWAISGERQDRNITLFEEKGSSFVININRELTTKDPVQLLSCQKLEEIDMHELARFFSAVQEFGDCFNRTTNTSLLKKLTLGMTKEDIKTYGVNTSTPITINGIGADDEGIGGTPRLEYFNIQGLQGVSNVDLSTSKNLREFYAAGSGLIAFNPADSTEFHEIELPLTIASITALDVTLPSYGMKFVKVGKGMDAEEVGVPSSLLVVKFTGMGDDEGVHAFLHNWLEMLRHNPESLRNAQIICRGLKWNNIPKEDIMTLASIPMCDVTGYIYCDEPYTQEEMNTLLTKFGQYTFNYNYTSITLVCDCDGDGITVSASGEGVSLDDEGNIHIIQGSKALFSGAGFPISGSHQDNYRWRVELDGEWYFGNESMPVFTFGDHNEFALNWLTGELECAECPSSEVTLKIGCYDKETYVSGEVTTIVSPRSYPTNVSVELKSAQQPPVVVEGEMQITSRGAYLFEAVHTPEYTGTMKLNGGVWELVGANPSYVTRNSSNETDPFIQFCLQVNSLPTDDLRLTLKYKSNWKNDLTLTAEERNIVIAAVIAQLVINDSSVGNPALFATLAQTGISHASPAYFSSMEVKNLIGDFNVTSLLRDAGIDPKSLVSFKNGSYNVIHYLKNVTSIDANSTGILGVDVSTHQRLESINVENTYSDIVF